MLKEKLALAPKNPELELVASIINRHYGYVDRNALDELDALLELDDKTMVPRRSMVGSISKIIWNRYPNEVLCGKVASIIVDQIS